MSLRRVTRRHYALGATALIVVIGTLVATAIGHPHRAARVPSKSVAAHKTSLSPAVAPSFSVFSTTAGEAPTPVEQYVRGLPVSLAAGSLHIAQSTGALEVKVAGDAASVCLFPRIPQKAVGSGCATIESAENPATPIVGTTRSAEGAVLVAALFTNGTHSVTIQDEGGSTISVPVVNNTIGVLDAHARSISWTDGSGQSYSAPVPG